VFQMLKASVAEILKNTNTDVKHKSVLVKPNMLGAFESIRGVTTDPRLIEAIVDVLTEEGASEIFVGDSPGGVEKGTVATAKKCGLYQASKGNFINFNEDVKLIPIKSRFIKKINIAGILNKVDIVINVPKLKTHGYMGMTGCIKNMFGIIVGPGKANLHFKAPNMSQFAELVVDIFQIRVPDLHIVDALTVMEGTGPTSGPLRKLDMVIAGTDAVAVDTFMAHMINFEPEKIKYIGIASKRGLGESSLDNISIHGDYIIIDDFVKPVTFANVEDKRISNKLNTKGLTYLYQLGARVPKLTRPEACNKCKRCIVNCPAQAIILKELPEIDYKKCISCFCCSELCHQDCYDILDNSEIFSKIFDSFEGNEENA
jgi:uncharacterized protein (DUF362 family)/NAD-dependent dihydropyrimidine dehydrogenase PreA subunit